MDTFYGRFCGTYYLYSGENGVPQVDGFGNKMFSFACDELAMAFDVKAGCLHKHGSRELVEEWLKKAKLKLEAAGLKDMADNLVMVSSNEWDGPSLTEFNRCLTNSGWVKYFYIGLQIGTFEQFPGIEALKRARISGKIAEFLKDAGISPPDEARREKYKQYLELQRQYAYKPENEAGWNKLIGIVGRITPEDILAGTAVEIVYA